MLKKYLKLSVLFVSFHLLGFLFYFSFISTNLFFEEKGNETMSKFIILLFELCLITIFLFKSDLLKKGISFSKTPMLIDISRMFLVLIIYIFFVVTNTIFFYYKHNVVSSPIFFSLGIINTLILAPIIEETIYRGIMINYLLPTNQNKKWHIILSFVFISLLFSLMHNNFEYYHFTHLLLFSLIISTFYYYQRNIYTVILFHSLFNLFVIMLNGGDLIKSPLSREWYFISSLIFLGLTIYTLFRLAKSYRNQ